MCGEILNRPVFLAVPDKPPLVQGCSTNFFGQFLKKFTPRFGQKPNAGCFSTRDCPIKTFCAVYLLSEATAALNLYQPRCHTPLYHSTNGWIVVCVFSSSSGKGCLCPLPRFNLLRISRRGRVPCIHFLRVVHAYTEHVARCLSSCQT